MLKQYPYRLFLFTALVALVAVFCQPSAARAADEAANPPPGFSLVSSAPGVDLYRKDYPNGSPDFVQVVDLSLGAKVVVMHGGVVSPGASQGAYGGDNATFQRKTIRQFWQEFTQSAGRPFCLTNGQFFYMPRSPSPLPFPLKKDGEIITDGYALKEFTGKKLMLELWPDRADIIELTKDSLYNSSAPDIVAGLREDAEKAKTKSVGRTFFGIADQDFDGSSELLLIFNSLSARPQEAADTLRSFGADQVMMLDGGGSTNLICQGNILINTDRQIPQVIGITAAQPVDFSAKILVKQPYQVVSQGEKAALELTVENRGLATWPVGQAVLKIASGNLFETGSSPIPQEVSPGEHASISVPFVPTADPGMREITLTVIWNNQQSPAEPKSTHLIIIPRGLTSKKIELQQKISAWEKSPDVKIQAQLTSWISENIKEIETSLNEQSANIPAGEDTHNLELVYALVVPLCMLPVGILIMLIVRRKQTPDPGSWDYDQE